MTSRLLLLLLLLRMPSADRFQLSAVIEINWQASLFISPITLKDPSEEWTVNSR